MVMGVDWPGFQATMISHASSCDAVTSVRASIFIYGIDVNGQTLVRGDVEIHSPYIQLLGAPQKDAQGRYYNVSWAIAPEVDLDKIVIAIAPRRAPDDFKVIDENDNAPRGCLWRKLNQRVSL